MAHSGDDVIFSSSKTAWINLRGRYRNTWPSTPNLFLLHRSAYVKSITFVPLSPSLHILTRVRMNSWWIVRIWYTYLTEGNVVKNENIWVSHILTCNKRNQEIKRTYMKHYLRQKVLFWTPLSSSSMCSSLFNKVVLRNPAVMTQVKDKGI